MGKLKTLKDITLVKELELISLSFVSNHIDKSLNKNCIKNSKI